MNFTVLGASGFVGRHVTAFLKREGHAVHAPSRGDTSLFSQSLGHVIYSIGLTADFRSRPFDTVEAHVGVLARILAEANFESLTYLSSTRVYSGSATGFATQTLSVNSADPSDLYNISKLMGESLCLSAGKGRARVVRLSNVIGPGDTHSGNFVASLIHEAKTGKITLRSHPDSAKDYVRVDDVAALLPRIATKGRDPVYNLASGIQISHRQWTNRIAELTGCEVEFAVGAPRLSFPDIDIAPLRRDFAFQPRPVLDLLPELL